MLALLSENIGSKNSSIIAAQLLSATCDSDTSSTMTPNNNSLSPGEYNATVNSQSVDIDITTSNDGQINIKGSDFSLINTH